MVPSPVRFLPQAETIEKLSYLVSGCLAPLRKERGGPGAASVLRQNGWGGRYPLTSNLYRRSSIFARWTLRLCFVGLRPTLAEYGQPRAGSPCHWKSTTRPRLGSPRPIANAAHLDLRSGQLQL